ncbi:dTMP kinase [Fervidobacterium pennivorans subsp. shakshaketiis]|uniref:Thymidylate kinase n=1 Tax=Fervidobacterium pennivorans (strain DSM 9078 / Ven5) TaxID=771875 RepID=H9UC40_FERPD|nr:dTMP kinase [Fervidobacterium pennivorans]AFG35083.1 thymidylate kinase [Fervidobacterium pennivorans DSM 9078]QIV78510.1 dTMP kinase [Fervidobacterium pennivorans subsp. keratinolyticus]
MFVSFEGIDGCGKSTQIEMFTKYLQSKGIEFVKVREPGGTKLGEKIRQLLISEEMTSRSELLLFLASRAQLVEEVIKPALEEGKIVVADRFAHSSVAYQGCGRNLGIDVVKMLNDFATDHVYPDLVFYIDIPAEVAISRINKEQRDRIEQEGLEFFEKVRNCYLELCKNEKNFVLIDGTKDVETISKQIIRIFEGLYKV